VTQLEAGALDIARPPTLTDYNRLKKDANYQAMQNPLTGAHYEAGFNLTIPPWDNKTLRQALTYAVDKQRFVDTILARFTDAVLAFPYIVLALSLAVVVGPSLTVIVAVIAFFSWAAIARIVRGQTLSIKEKEYIEAARSLGAGPFRIMFLDILPNLLAPVLVIVTLYIPTAVVFEATLSYLGLGIQPPTPDWGAMIAEGQTFITVKWQLSTIPGVAVVITGLGLSLIGDGLADLLRPE